MKALCSLNYLKQFPVDYLKTDGGFVRQIGHDMIARAMVESINHTGHVMGIQTVAEWAEDQVTLDVLRTIGVDYAQGYAVGHPMPFAELTRETRQLECPSPLPLVDKGRTNLR